VFTVRGRPDDVLAITFEFPGVPVFTEMNDKVLNKERTYYLTESNGGKRVDSDSTTLVVELTVNSRVLADETVAMTLGWYDT